MFRAYKYRIYPTPEQRAGIEQTFGCCRLVYNIGLALKMDVYKQHGIKLSSIDLCYQLAEMKQDYDWLREVDSQALQASLKKLDVAFKNFFKGSGYPKFKKRSNAQSFQAPNNKREVDFENQLLTIPKISNIPIKISREFKGQIKTVTISRVPSGKYFASILVDTKIDLPAKPKIEPSKTTGFDLGLTHFLITSTGKKWENPRYLRGSMSRLKVLQRRASRKKRGSANRKKANKRLAIQHEKVANQRKDFLQKLSTKMVRESQATTFCVEDLSVKNMVKNHKLAQAISDVGWSEFVRMLEYKCEWYGKNLIKIGRFEPSTKTCSCCGTINETLTLADREWTCETCGESHDRDINAAINVKEMGLKTIEEKQKSGRGTSVEPVELLTKVGTVKQEYMVI